MTKKNPYERVGEVFALHTIYGDSLIQIADMRDMMGSILHVIRVFKKRFLELPDDITEIIQGDHDFIANIDDIEWLLKKSPKDTLPSEYSKELKMRGIVDKRTNCATLIGNFNVPMDFKTPRYFKRANRKDYVPRHWNGPLPPLNEWYISFENPDENDVTPYVSISIYEWVTEHLKIGFDPKGWFPSFVELGPGPIVEPLLIVMLEDDFSLDMWLPSDFEWKNKKYFHPTKEWVQIMQEREEREKEMLEKRRLRAEKQERLKAQGIEFKFWKTQAYKDLIKLVKE